MKTRIHHGDRQSDQGGGAFTGRQGGRPGRTSRRPRTGIIYGDGKPPLPISLDYADLHQRIYAGHFLTTIHDVEVDGVKHRVIPRDFQLDAVRDLPLHVDFMRLGEGATIRVNIPIHVRNADQSPGVKRGGTVCIVTHTIEVRCRADAIPDRASRSMSSGLEINHSKHLSDITLPEGVRVVAAPGHHAGHGRAAVGLCGRNEGGRRGRGRRRGRGCCRRGCRRAGRAGAPAAARALRALLRRGCGRSACGGAAEKK